MTFPHAVDIDTLVSPISESEPCGIDIREDQSPTSDYYTIKDSRNGARAAERSAVFDDSEADLLTPWREVIECAEKILSSQSKDLEVASWYTEALIRLHGFAGLRDGFALISRLIEDYWDGLYPQPDEDGLETKVAPLTGLNGDGGEGTLMAPIRSAPITPEGDLGAFSFFQYQQARDADRIADDEAKSARLSSLGYSLADVEQCVQSASPQWAVDMVETLEEAIAHYKNISETLRTHCGHEAPPSTNISTLLDEVLRTIRFMYKAQLEAAAAAEAEVSTVETDTADTEQDSSASVQVAVATRTVNGPITSREDALRLLEEVARYFRTYEPHTPLGPGLERLIEWGRMTVSELMAELLPDEHSRAVYSQLTGVKLDGSDTQRYVAPPPVNSSASAASEPAASAESAPADDGWGGESKAKTEAEVGW